MTAEGLQSILQRRAWRGNSAGSSPLAVRNHLERDFSAAAPNERWVTDITYVRTAEGCYIWFWPWAFTITLSSARRMSAQQNRQLMLNAVLMAIWQRGGRSVLILQSDRGRCWSRL